MSLHVSLELQLKGEENPPLTELGQIAEVGRSEEWKTAEETGESRKVSVGQRATMEQRRRDRTARARVQWFGEDDEKKVEKQ